MTEIASLKKWVSNSIKTSILEIVNLRLGHTRFEVPGYLFKYAKGSWK